MFTGSIVALVMPMSEKGKVCRSSLKKLIDYHVASGTSAIVSVGIIGEPAILSHDERGDVVMMTPELADGRILVIAGIGANATVEVTSLTQRFNDSGVVGCLTVTSHYDRPTQEGLFQYFRAIAEHTDLPQILYNVSSHTGCDMLPETVGRLAKVKNIIAIEEATGSLSCIHQIKELVSDDFTLLNDDDVTGLDFVQLGDHGVISVTSNIAARDMAEICELAVAGQLVEARVINRRLMSLYNKLLVELSPTLVKRACKESGLVATDMLRLSMTPITGNVREIVKVALRHAGLLQSLGRFDGLLSTKVAPGQGCGRFACYVARDLQF